MVATQLRSESMRTNRLILQAALLTALLSSTAPAQEPRFVSVSGKEIVAADGSPLLLRGINLGNWLVPEGYMFKFDSATSPRLINGVLSELVGPEEAASFWKEYRERYITRGDVRFIRSLGLNSVRVPFHWRLFEPEEASGEAPGFALLDRLLQWCSEEHLGVILDMHCAPGGQTGDNIDDSWGYPFLFDSPGEQDRTIRIWKSIAGRYRGDPTVIGYDLLNEPIPPFFDRDRLNLLLEPLYRRIVGALREVDTNHIVFLGGAQWNTNFSVFGPPFDAKAVYTFHKYWCDTTQAMVQEYVEYRDRHRVPIWMGESGENTAEWIASFRRLQERNSIGWCFWPYKKMDARSCIVTFDRPEDWEVVRTYANAPRTSFGNIRALRPPREQVRAALRGFLERCQFEHVRPNRAYIEALGCTPGH
jgi:endoglucanase